MKIRDDILLTWLVAFRMNLNGVSDLDQKYEGWFSIPTAVKDELCDRGWTQVLEVDGEGGGVLHITDSGTVASDLFAPECGVDPCPVE